MSTLTKDQISEIVKKYGKDENDTGSPEVQVAIMTQRIKDLTEHVKTHKKDHHNRRGLSKLVGQRRRLLRYMQKDDYNRYLTIIKELGLRK
ncbi:MAG: 30S ribosomal protein S15 [Candidatus Marinimicrobia bacterium]|nr:30S ribosomal protein S15 [Candidatus Neomarinimicrobiota bacterium]